MSHLTVVSINLFSGRPNPEWRLSAGAVADLARRFESLTPVGPAILHARSEPGFDPADDPLLRPDSGYRGFEIWEADSHGRSPRFVVYERLVFDAGAKRVLQDQDPDVWLEERLYDTAPDFVRTELDFVTFEELRRRGSEMPIRNLFGPSVQLACRGGPSFLGRADPFNRFRGQNNCYNYATNVLNASSRGAAIPGHPNRRTPFELDALRARLSHDGLEFCGMQLPSDCPPTGVHYLAAVLRRVSESGPVRDYHFIRLNENGQWSHKDGTGHVTNRDNARPQQVIDDLTRAKFIWFPELAGIYRFHEALRHRIR